MPKAKSDPISSGQFLYDTFPYPSKPSNRTKVSTREKSDSLKPLQSLGDKGTTPPSEIRRTRIELCELLNPQEEIEFESTESLKKKIIDLKSICEVSENDLKSFLDNTVGNQKSLAILNSIK